MPHDIIGTGTSDIGSEWQTPTGDPSDHQTMFESLVSASFFVKYAEYQSTQLELVRTIYFLKTQDTTCSSSSCDSDVHESDLYLLVLAGCHQFAVRVILFKIYSSCI